MKYHIWQHIDSGIEVVVDANSEEEALDQAKALFQFQPNTYDAQILANAQRGCPEIIDSR